LESFYSRERTRHASFAVIVFVFSTFHVHMVFGGVSSLLTFDALLFVLLGLPLAALVLGSFSFHLHKGVAAMVFREPPTNPSETMVKLVKLLDLVLKVVVVLIGWYIVKEAWEGIHQASGMV